jgi:uncharacterized protein (DUF433 family)
VYQSAIFYQKCTVKSLKSFGGVGLQNGFHAVNSGSNPLGDAKENQGVRIKSSSFFRCGVVGWICPTLCPTDLKKIKKGIMGHKGVIPMERLDRITHQPEIMGGKACIRGMRVTVGMIVGQMAAGLDVDNILADYPYLEREDISQALRYAAWRAEERELLLANA